MEDKDTMKCCPLLRRMFSVSRSSWSEYGEGGTRSVVSVLGSWLTAHEEAQIMLASILVVIGIWWVVRTVLSLLINLVFPILIVFLAVICVPQFRAPLLGQNYPALADLLRSVLLKMAENINT